MVATNGALPGAGALRKFLFRVFAYIIAVALTLVARLAEVSISPTKPLSCRTTILTFELNEILAVLVTVLNRNFAAVGAYKLLWLERPSILRLVHSFGAILPPSEVWVLTFEALEVGVYSHCILVRFLKIRRLWILQLLVFVASLKLKSLG